MGLFTPLAGVYFADDLKAQGSSEYLFIIASDDVFEPDCDWRSSQGVKTVGVVDISAPGTWVETVCKNRGIPCHRLPTRSEDEAKAWVCRNVLPRLLPSDVSFSASQ